MYRITGPQIPAAIEQEIAELYTEQQRFLQLPVHPKKWWFGGEAGLVQLAITWARNNEDAVLITYVKPTEDPLAQLKRMACRMFGFVSLLMANEIVDTGDGVSLLRGATDSPKRSLRPEAYAQCRRVVNMMFRPISEFALGSKVYLISIDHSTMWAIPWLYTKTKSVRDRIAFTSLAQDLISKVTETVSANPVDQESIQQIGAILHELFKNTHEWARFDSNKAPWRRSVRGISIERHSWSRAGCADIVKENPALRNYLSSFSEHTLAGHSRFLELTVFDSGLGLARQWLGSTWDANIELSEEYKACQECLTKHRSTALGRERGLGLAEVMSTLNELRGFMRIRTGRLSVYRDFSTFPLSTSDDKKLYDYSTASGELTQLAPVYGTHYQMLIPILRNERR